MYSRVENGEIINTCKTCGTEIRNCQFHFHGLAECEECEKKDKKDLTEEE